MNLTPERLSEIEKRCNAATAGPWRYDYVDGESYCVLAKTNTISDLVCTMAGTAKDCDTADFIAHARTDIPDLLSEIKRLRERDSELTDLLDMAHDEFQRVEAHTDDTELQGIALRGQAKIRQNVPVIRQRDELENAVIKLNGINDQLNVALSDAQAALKVKDEALRFYANGENLRSLHGFDVPTDRGERATAALQPGRE
jgi:hypothetical protein